MTDNSDFMSRYLPPENAEAHREHPGPADELTEEVSLSDLRLPEPGAPQPPQMPPVADTSSHRPRGGDRARPAGRGARQRVSGAGTLKALTLSPNQHRRLATVEPCWPPPGPAPSLRSVRRRMPGTRTRCRGRRRRALELSAGSGAASHAPAPIPPRPQFDQPNQLPPPPQRWSPPRIDPSQRWAPRADLRTAGSAPIRHVQVEEVVKRRREPAEMGWRKAVYACTGGLVNLGAGPHERQLRDWKARVTSNIPGNYQIASVSVKGGVGKTRVTAGVGTVFAAEREQHGHRDRRRHHLRRFGSVR